MPAPPPSNTRMQSEGLVDNPDQRITSDVAQFTESALGLSETVLRAGVDMVSFSGGGRRRTPHPVASRHPPPAAARC